MAEPARQQPRPLPPLSQVRAGMRDLSDLLLVRPRPSRESLLPIVRDLCGELRALHLPHGLAHLVLGNLLKDLRAGGFDAPYYAEQLTRAADLLDS